MKIEIPIIGLRRGYVVVDDFFENVCAVANINIGTIIGRPSKNQEENAKIFILIKDDVIIQKKYEDVPRERLYPRRQRKKLVYFFEVDIADNMLDFLTDEEKKLVRN